MPTRCPAPLPAGATAHSIPSGPADTLWGAIGPGDRIPQAPGAQQPRGRDEGKGMVMDQQAREQAFMAALTTEHFALQSTASTTVSESGTRASLYVMALSSSLVAIGFSVGSKRAFVPLVATVVPVVFLLGIFTVVRLVETGVQNLLCLRRIAHIHGYYRRLLPEAPASFDPLGSFAATTTSTSAPSDDPQDDPDLDRGGAEEHRAALAMLAIPQRRYVLTGLFSIAAMVAAINSIVGGAGVALLATRLLGAPQELLAVVLGVLAAIGIMAVSLTYQQSRYQVVVAPTAASSLP